MAQIIRMVDDLDPALDADHTVTITLDTKTVEIDLCEKNLIILAETLAPYFKAGRVLRPMRGSTRAGKMQGSNGRTTKDRFNQWPENDEHKAVREWLNANSDRHYAPTTWIGQADRDRYNDRGQGDASK